MAGDLFNAGCVLEAPVEIWREPDLVALRGRMMIDEVEVGTGKGGDVRGHPLEALVWLANAPVARGRQLKTDEFGLLGSVVKIRWVEPGDLV
jgi:2-oxo-3-hexenedioate decarboxylase/2-keto-4-pentenoate hydratase